MACPDAQEDKSRTLSCLDAVRHLLHARHRLAFYASVSPDWYAKWSDERAQAECCRNSDPRDLLLP